MVAKFNSKTHLQKTFIVFSAVLRIRIHRIQVFLGLPDPDPLVRGMDPDPDPALDPDLDPSIIMQK
jgi:hypothetical protein